MGIIRREVYDDESELIESGVLSTKKPREYVNNEELYKEFVEYHKEKVWCEYLELPPPKLSDAIGDAVIKIATNRCNFRDYVRYTNNWKEEMIGNAIVTCVASASKFNPILYNKPFSYITMIADNAIKEMLNKQYKQDYIKNKLYDKHKGHMSTGGDDDASLLTTEDEDMYKDCLERISKFEESQERRRRRNSSANKKEKEATLDEYFS